MAFVRPSGGPDPGFDYGWWTGPTGDGGGGGGGGGKRKKGGGGGRGGGGRGGAAGQARALTSSGGGGGVGGGSVTGTTAFNPAQQGASDAATRYEQGVAAGTSEETQRELGRFRDEISTGMRAEGEGAMGRGADPTLFRTRALGAGQRDLTNLQARLADVSLGRRAEAVGLRTGAAGAMASENRMMHLGTLSQRLAEQRAQMEQQELQHRLSEAPYQRLASMMSLVGSQRPSYSVLGGGEATGAVLGGSSSARAYRSGRGGVAG